MPIIPLLKKPGPIANAPAAVLDNQRRPNVDNRSVQRAVGELADSYKNPLVDARAAAAPYEALGAVGEAVMKAGGVLNALAVKRAEAETDIQVAEADQAMQDAFNKHAAWRTQTPDSSLWEGNLTETLGGARKAIEGNEKLRPAARDQIRMRMDKFEGDARGDLMRDGAKQAFALAKSYDQAGIQRDMTAKNYDGAEQRAAASLAKGRLFPHEAADLEDVIVRSKEADAKEAEKAAREALRTNKLTAIDADPHKVDFTDVPDPLLKEQLETHRREVLARRRFDAADSVANGIAGGSINTEQDVRDLASPDFDESEQAKWIGVLKQNINEGEKEKARANGPANEAALDADIRAWDPETDPDRAKLREFVTRKMQLPAGLRQDVQSLLNRKRKQLDPSPDEVVKDMGESVISDLLRAGQFGPYANPTPTGDKAKDAADLKAAAVLRQQASWKAAGIRRAYNKELKRNPKMTELEAQATLSRIMARPVEMPAAPSTLFQVNPKLEPIEAWNDKLSNYGSGPENDLPAGGAKQTPLIDGEPPLPQ